MFVFIGVSLEHMFVIARSSLLYIYMVSQLGAPIAFAILPTALSFVLLSVSAVLSVCMCYDGC